MNIERWAQRVCERELGQIVVVHDDQSEPGMYDLRVGPMDAPLIAIECVSSVDSEFLKLWNAGPAQGPIRLALAGDWIVVLAPETQIKGLRPGGLEDLLRKCEAEGARNVYVDWRLKRVDPFFFDALDRIGVVWMHCARSRGQGKVYLNVDSAGGVVDEYGSAVASWIGDFLRANEQADVISKLTRARASECHVFVPVGWGGAPWPVESYLISGIANLPSSEPSLPPPVASVWIASTHAPEGVLWDGARWRRFDARAKGVA